MKNNFDLKKFLVENKLTTNSKIIKEEWSEDRVQQLMQLAQQVGFDRLMDKYAPDYIDSLPDLQDYIGAIYDSGGEIGDEFLNPETLKADIIDYAKNL